MGFLIGDTTVIENGGPYVEYSRTYSHVQYSPERVGIGFPCPPGMKMSDAMLLARSVVDIQLGLPIADPHKADELCRLVFNEPLVAFRREVIPAKKKRRQYLDEEY